MERDIAVKFNPPLQWGRDQLIAELRPVRSGFHIHHMASMGPRSADRGIGFDVGNPQGDQLLQWGRDQLIAELLQAGI